MNRTVIQTSILIAVSSIALACSSSSNNNAAPGGKGDGGPGGSSGGSTGSGAGGASGAGVGTGGAGVGGGTTGAGGAVTGCTLTPCQGKKVFGQTLDACCLTATTCGVSSPAYMGGQCLSADLLKNIPDASTLNQTLDLDPACPDRSIGDAGAGLPFDAGVGGVLQGCCDKTNVCGIAFKLSAGGFTISQCITPAKAGGFGGDAGPSIACTYK